MSSKYSVADIKGVVVPVFTPIDKDENIDFKALKKLIDHIIHGGVDGIFLMGSSGEFCRFTEPERIQIIKKGMEYVDGRVPVYVGVSDCGTRMVIKNIKIAEKLGADFVVATLPYYYSINNLEEQISFFTDIADNSSLPVLLYNIPQNVNSKIKIETIQAVASHPNIVGVKDSTGDFDLMKTLIETRPNPDFKVFVGKEAVAEYGITNGADGIVPSMGNVYPKLFATLYKHAKNGDKQEAQKCQQIVDEVNKYNSCADSAVTNFIVRKQLLANYNIMDAYMARPRMTLPDNILKELKDLAEQYKEWAE
jgi:4-hydroxy-tetrahydrodipicolinate synthase